MAWFALIGIDLFLGAHPKPRSPIGLLIVVAAGVAVFVLALSPFLAIRNAWRTRRAIRQEKAAEQPREQRTVESDNGCYEEQLFVARLVADHPFLPCNVGGSAVCSDEIANLDLLEQYVSHIEGASGSICSRRRHIRVVRGDQCRSWEIDDQWYGWQQADNHRR